MFIFRIPFCLMKWAHASRVACENQGMGLVKTFHIRRTLSSIKSSIQIIAHNPNIDDPHCRWDLSRFQPTHYVNVNVRTFHVLKFIYKMTNEVNIDLMGCNWTLVAVPVESLPRKIYSYILHNHFACCDTATRDTNYQSDKNGSLLTNISIFAANWHERRIYLMLNTTFFFNVLRK